MSSSDNIMSPADIVTYTLNSIKDICYTPTHEERLHHKSYNESAIAVINCCVEALNRNYPITEHEYDELVLNAMLDIKFEGKRFCRVWKDNIHNRVTGLALWDNTGELIPFELNYNGDPTKPTYNPRFI